MSNLLVKFQSADRAKALQMFQDLTHSIDESFHGDRCRHNDATRYELQHDGLTSVSVRLDVDAGDLTIYIYGNVGLGHGAETNPNWLDIVKKNVKLNREWLIKIHQYSRVSFECDLTVLTDERLQDLVAIMERVGFVARTYQSRRVF